MTGRIQVIARKCLVWGCLCLCLELFGFFSGTTPYARANEGDILIKATLGYDGNIVVAARNNRAKVKVDNRSSKHSFEGTVSVNTMGENPQSGSVISQKISVAAGMSKNVEFGVYFINLPEKITFVLKNEQGEEVASQTIGVKVYEANRLIAGVLSDKEVGSSGAVSELGGYRVEIQDIELPKKEEWLEAFDLIFVEDVKLKFFQKEQLAALTQWINQGGTLIIDNWGKASASNCSYMTGADFQEKKGKDGSLLTYKGKDGTTYKYGKDGIYRFANGDGAVVIFRGASKRYSYDFFSEFMQKHYGGFARAKMDTSYCENGNSIYLAMGKLPNFNMVVILLILYILLITLISRRVFRTKSRQQLLWVYVPLTSLLFVLVIYLLGDSTRVENTALLHNTVVEYEKNGTTGRAKAYITVCNPDNKDFSLTIPEGMHIFEKPAVNMIKSKQQQESSLVQKSMIDNGSGTVDFHGYSAFDYIDLVGCYDVDMVGSYSSDLYCSDYVYEGTFTNQSGREMKEACFLAGRRLFYLGDIQNKETVRINRMTPSTIIRDGGWLNVDGKAKQWLSFGETEKQNKTGDGYLSAMSRLLTNGSEQENCTKPRIFCVMEGMDSIYSGWNVNTKGATICELNLDVDYRIGGARFIPDLASEAGNTDKYIFDNEDNIVEYHLDETEEVEKILYAKEANVLSKEEEEAYFKAGMLANGVSVQLYNFRTGVYDTVLKNVGDKVTKKQLDLYVSNGVLRMKYVVSDMIKGELYDGTSLYRPIISAVIREAV